MWTNSGCGGSDAPPALETRVSQNREKFLSESLRVGSQKFPLPVSVNQSNFRTPEARVLGPCDPVASPAETPVAAGTSRPSHSSVREGHQNVSGHSSVRPGSLSLTHSSVRVSNLSHSSVRENQSAMRVPPSVVRTYAGLPDSSVRGRLQAPGVCRPKPSLGSASVCPGTKPCKKHRAVPSNPGTTVVHSSSSGESMLTRSDPKRPPYSSPHRDECMAPRPSSDVVNGNSSETDVSNSALNVDGTTHDTNSGREWTTVISKAKMRQKRKGNVSPGIDENSKFHPNICPK